MSRIYDFKLLFSGNARYYTDFAYAQEQVHFYCPNIYKRIRQQVLPTLQPMLRTVYYTKHIYVQSRQLYI